MVEEPLFSNGKKCVTYQIYFFLQKKTQNFFFSLSLSRRVATRVLCVRFLSKNVGLSLTKKIYLKTQQPALNARRKRVWQRTFKRV